MSEQRSYSIQCPKCRNGWDVQLYESVNVSTHPELRDKLFANQLNAVTCPGCQFSFRVDKPLLYSDPARKLLIYWYPAPQAKWQEGEERFDDWLREAGMIMPDGVAAPEVHLTFSRIEMIERIFLREADLDVRVIEYVKYLIYTRNGNRIDPEVKSLLFNAQDSTPEALCFVILDEPSKKFESVLQYQRSAYQALAETFGQEDKTADLLEMFPGPHVSARALLIEELKEQALETEPEQEQEQEQAPEDPGEPPAGP